MYHLGYDDLNVGRIFKIQITDANNGDEVSKQVDVFAKDDDTVVIAECKSSATKSSGSFQKDIMEFAALKKSFVIWNHRRDARLLQHDLRNPDPVCIFRAAPRQIALKLAKPSQQLFSE